MTVNTDNFNLAATLECGQFFRYNKQGDGYNVRAGHREAFITQDGGKVTFHNISDNEYENFWADFFDFGRNYSEIINNLAGICPVMKKAAEFAPGIRLLNQDPWETLICFILSANNRIPMIMKAAEAIVSRFGGGTGFPAPDAFIKTESVYDGLVGCKAGFRAKYIINAAEAVSSGNVEFDTEHAVPTVELRKRLMLIKGVGVKVADCVMLFSMGRREVFPVDVWIARAVRVLYHGGKEIPLDEIRSFAAEKFGGLAGYANQLLFHYARLNRII
jgi:N-glycosylase/DNA lyase